MELICREYGWYIWKGGGGYMRGKCTGSRYLRWRTLSQLDETESIEIDQGVHALQGRLAATTGPEYHAKDYNPYDRHATSASHEM